MVNLLDPVPFAVSMLIVTSVIIAVIFLAGVKKATPGAAATKEEVCIRPTIATNQKRNDFAICLSFPPEIWRSGVLELLQVKELARFTAALEGSSKSIQLVPLLLDTFTVSQRVVLRENNELWFTKYNMRLLNVEVSSFSFANGNAISKLCRHAHTLDMSGYNLFITQSILTVLASCHGLQSFTTADYPGDPFVITDEVGQALIDRCPNITHLSFTDCGHITPAMFVKLSAAYPNLRSLTLNCTEYNHYVTGEVLTQMLQNCPHLTGLHVQSALFPHDEVASLSSIATHCNCLTSLTLAGVHVLEDENMIDLVPVLQNLSYLDLTFSDSLCGETVMLLAQHCPKLETLILFGLPLSDEALCDLARGCPKLKKLDLESVQNITDRGVCAIAENCASLTDVNLSYTKVTNASVIALEQHCTKLRSLDTKGCPFVS